MKQLKKTDKEFEIFINALSVGWHLRGIFRDCKVKLGEEEIKKIIKWANRHNIYEETIRQNSN